MDTFFTDAQVKQMGHKGQFKKGQSGNPGGRPTDPNRKKLRKLVSDASVDLFDKFLEEIEKLDGKEFTTAYLAMVEFALPKLARQELTDSEGNAITLNVVFGRKNKDAQKS